MEFFYFCQEKEKFFSLASFAKLLEIHIPLTATKLEALI